MTTADLRALQSVHSRLQAGDPPGALADLDALPPPVGGNADGLFLRALVLQAMGRWAEARTAFESALEQSPDHAGILNSYGNFLDDMGERGAAVDALVRSTRLLPDNNDYLINLGIVATNAGRYDVAEDALARAIRAAPAVPRGWSALGLLEQKRGKTDTAVQSYRRAIELDGEDVRSRHNLATVLRETDQPEAALEEAETAVRQGPVPPETATLRAHLLAEVNRIDEAVAEYRNILTQVPEQIDAHEALAALLPQIDRGSEALTAYRDALRARPTSVPLWASAFRSALALQDHVQLAAWGQEAEALIGPRPEVLIARAAALSRMGNHPRAIEILRALLTIEPDHAVAQANLAQVLVTAGDAKAAEAHALRATELDPLDQVPWALLTVIWRLLDDPREQWLADYDRLVMPIELDAASGFFDELAARLAEMHAARGTTRTHGHLFARRDPLIERLVAQIRNGVLNRLRQLPDDPTHPYLSRKAEAIDFSASWSVQQQGEAIRTGHIHQGWISAVLPVLLPPGDGDAGALSFGLPDAALGLDLPARRIERPAVGRLVIFPSYLWHGNLPFQGDASRLTVVFDTVPVG